MEIACGLCHLTSGLDAGTHVSQAVLYVRLRAGVQNQRTPRAVRFVHGSSRVHSAIIRERDADSSELSY